VSAEELELLSDFPVESLEADNTPELVVVVLA
jgi:hypothetical protein